MFEIFDVEEHYSMLPKKLCLPIAKSHTCHGLRLTACNNGLKSFLKSYSSFQTTAFSVSPKNIQICSFIINISANLKERNVVKVRIHKLQFYFFLASLPSLQHLYSPLTQWSITQYKADFNSPLYLEFFFNLVSSSGAQTNVQQKKILIFFYN